MKIKSSNLPSNTTVTRTYPGKAPAPKVLEIPSDDEDEDDEDEIEELERMDAHARVSRITPVVRAPSPPPPPPSLPFPASAAEMAATLRQTSMRFNEDIYCRHRELHVFFSFKKVFGIEIGFFHQVTFVISVSVALYLPRSGRNFGSTSPILSSFCGVIRTALSAK